MGRSTAMLVCDTRNCTPRIAVREAGVRHPPSAGKLLDAGMAEPNRSSVIKASSGAQALEATQELKKRGSPLALFLVDGGCRG